MFTGIIQKTAKLKRIEHFANESKLFLELVSNDIQLGESIAVNGVCLTVAEIDKNSCLFYISPETIRCTNLGALSENSFVNIERALRVGDSLSGHFVQGHVDGTAKLISVEKAGQSWACNFTLPEELLRYCIEKGSIALNGISLTINKIEGGKIFIQIVPHTWQNTNFAYVKPGDIVNVEVDILAKYTEKLCKK